MHPMLAYIIAMGVALLALATILLCQGIVMAYPNKAQRFGRYMLWAGIAVAVVAIGWLGIMLWRYFAILQ